MDWNFPIHVYNSLRNTLSFSYIPGRLEFSYLKRQTGIFLPNAMQFLSFQMQFYGGLELFPPKRTGTFPANNEAMVASDGACFWPTLFPQCEFDAVKLIWDDTHKSRSPARLTFHFFLFFVAIGSTWPKGPLSMFRENNLVGLWVPADLNPPKDIQLSVWFVCWFGVCTELFILVGGA